MIAPGFAGLEEQLWLWLFAMIRPGAAFFAAPVTGARVVPVQLRLIIALAVGIAAMGGSGIKLPNDGLISLSGFALIAGEIIIGLAIGFTIQIGYAAAFVAGETISNAMGLGFASMSDPQTGQSTPVIGQFLSIIATLIFLAMDGHLILASTIVLSYDHLPPGSGLLSADAALRLAYFGGSLFVAGLAIAFPVGSALLLVQIILGLLARSAPSMNLFAVGLPATLTLGLVMLAMAAPLMMDGITQTLVQSLEYSDSLARGG
ncbi:flagellar biosynthetic protein FliR [Parasphingorhabdus cellanae]|uniref:Flagellar biosynthetic protein FliR n=1 Tax=Parasphingorhabdus cellanae TaxID=2806553 RepID=A0ABX7T8K5_9SPHN|nr:flagellar biosynthetic protein FliR [Parasphingorhabdus cellanae]QTD56472.1 flagellar biosynthetic protein FliR [Parasphingorhabdus cellanae]